MLTRFQKSAVYDVIYTYPDTQAYVKGRFEGFVRQPAKIGPVVYSNTSPSYARLKPVTASASGDDGGSSGGIIAAIVAVVLARGRGRVLHAAPAHGRRAGVSARFVGAKVAGSLVTLIFVICFNFFLFRVVEGDPVANLYRGRNLSEQQRDKLTKQFGLDKSTGAQFVSYLKETATLQLRAHLHRQRSRYGTRSSARPGRRSRWWASRRSCRRSSACCSASPRPGEDARAPTTRVTAFSVGTYSMPDFWLGMVLLTLFAVVLGWFPVGGLQDAASDATGLAKLADEAQHMFLPCLTLTVGYLGEYAIIMRSSLLDTMREDYLVLARAKGLRDVLVRNRHAVPNAILPVVALLAINFGFVLSGAIAVEAIFSWPGLGLATYEALKGPDLPMLQGLFLVFSASVIFFNLVADLLYGYLDPRVRPA